MLPYYYSTNEDDEFFTEERCHILELVNNKDDSSHSIARARVEPNVTTAWHRLIDTSETYVILSGTGVLEINEDESQELNKGDVFRIPPNSPQRISNIGDDDLIFLCICIPAFGDDTYEMLE